MTPPTSAEALDAPSLTEPAVTAWFDEAVPVLRIPDAMDFEALRQAVRDDVPALLPQINGRASRLDLGERTIQLFDLRRLIHLLRDEFSVDITGLYASPQAVKRYAERELKLKLFLEREAAAPAEPAPPVALEPVGADGTTGDDAAQDADTSADPDAPIRLPTDLRPEDIDGEGGLRSPEPDVQELDPATLDDLASEAPRRSTPEAGSRTLSVHRTLRSGAVVRFDGDVIVFGDVNPGANVIATGKVVVLGALKGMAHAGAEGDEDATILAFDFRPTQVRIGRKIAIPPTKRSASPELVVVRGDDIVIEPYTGRFR